MTECILIFFLLNFFFLESASVITAPANVLQVELEGMSVITAPASVLPGASFTATLSADASDVSAYDWIGIYDPSGVRISYQDNNAQTSHTFTFTAGTTLGTWSLKYVSSVNNWAIKATKSFTVGNPITKTTLFAPRIAAVGASFTVTLQATDSDRAVGDWVGIFSGTTRLSYQNNNGQSFNTFQFSASTAGLYSIEYSSSPNGWTSKAVSYIQIVGTTTTQFYNPPTTAIKGTNFQLDLVVKSTDTNPGDWIGIYDSTGSTRFSWQPNNGKQTNTFSINVSPTNVPAGSNFQVWYVSPAQDNQWIARAITTIKAVNKTMKIIVPIYFGAPGATSTSCTNSQYQAMKNQGSTILGVYNTGEEPTVTNPNQIRLRCAIEMAAAGVELVGYVSTKIATVDSNGVWTQTGFRTVSDIQNRINWWFQYYGTNIKGIFLDETSNYAQSSANLWGVDHIAFYKNIITYIRTQRSNAKVVLNPGSIIDIALANAADVSLISERPFTDYVPSDGLCTHTWTTAYGSFPLGLWCPSVPIADKAEILKNPIDNNLLASKIAVICYGAPSNYGAGAQNLVTYAANDKIDYVYFTDVTLPNPWGGLSSFFSSLVNQVKQQYPGGVP